MRGLDRLFREKVPEDLVLAFFNTIGVKGSGDCNWWSKDVLTEEVKEKLLDLLPQLEPYYYPHKAFLIKREMSDIRFIQLFRQLALCINHRLEKRESKGREVYKRKTTLYRLVSENPQPKVSSFLVEFN